MATANDTIASLSNLSIQVLSAQKVSIIIWVVLCVCGFVIGLFQLITMFAWKPLRNMDNSLIMAIAVGDMLKDTSYGLVASKRLYLASANMTEVSSQRTCVLWVLGIAGSTEFVNILIVGLSADRLLAVAVPLWYKNVNAKRKVIPIGISVIAGLASMMCMLIGTREDEMQAVCTFPTSPTRQYQKFSVWFENSAALAILVINVSTAVIVVLRWRSAIKKKKDMKAFKRNIHLNALKVLLAVVGLYLVSSAMGILWLTLVNVLGWSPSARMSYTPIGACFGLIRGVLDFPIYILLVQDYRAGFTAVFLKCKCWQHNSTPVLQFSTQVTTGTNAVKRVARK